MYNITKIEGGFLFNDREYTFIEIDGLQYTIVSDTQVHIYTDYGIILFDLTCSIDEQIFTDINQVLNDLKNFIKDLEESKSQLIKPDIFTSL